MITPENLTFRRIQTDDPTKVTIFASLDGTLADGSPAEGPWQSVTLDLTQEQIAVAVALVTAAKQQICDRINAP